MAKVVPLPQPNSSKKEPEWNSEIQYEDIYDSSKNQIVILMDGLGSPNIVDNLRIQPIIHPYCTMKGLNLHIVPYGTKENEEKFTLKTCITNLASDIYHSKKKEPGPNRPKRLNNLCETIKKYLMKIEEPYDTIILIGFSHGSIIMYSALLKLFADASISLKHYEKLRFYAISPPFHFPPNILSSFIKYDNRYYIDREDKKVEVDPSVHTFLKVNTVIHCSIREKQRDRQFGNRKKDVPPFLQIHYEDDMFFIKNNHGENLIVKTVMKIAQCTVLHDITSHFTKHLNEIKQSNEQIKQNSDNDVFHVNEKQNVVMIRREKKWYDNTSVYIKKLYEIGYSWTQNDMDRLNYLYSIHLSHAHVFMVCVFFANVYPLQNAYYAAHPYLGTGGENVQKPTHIYILGRRRKIHLKKGARKMKEYIMYNKKLVTLQKAYAINNQIAANYL
jgi:hypothetical protein